VKAGGVDVGGEDVQAGADGDRVHERLRAAKEEFVEAAAIVGACDVGVGDRLTVDEIDAAEDCTVRQMGREEFACAVGDGGGDDEELAAMVGGPGADLSRFFSGHDHGGPGLMNCQTGDLDGSILSAAR